MAKTLSVRYRLLFMLIAISVFLIVANSANAQLTKQDQDSIATTLSEKINTEIRNHQGATELREKVVRRLSECSLFYFISSKHTPDVETIKRFTDVYEINVEMVARISIGISTDSYNKIIASAKSSIDKISERQDKKAAVRLLRNCKSFHDPREIKEALMELTY